MNWKALVMSSADPHKVSLTLKGLIPLALSVAVLFNWNITEGNLDEVVSTTVAAVSALVALYGAVRKVYFAGKKS